MTISSTVDKNIYSGDGSTTVFPFTFKLLDNSQMQVFFKNILTEVSTEQTTGFSTSGAPGIGNVTFTIAPDANTVITLLRNMPIVQETDYNEYDPFPAETHEAALDYLTMLAQQLNEQIARSFKFDSSASADLDFDYNLPNPLHALGQYIRINDDGTGFEYSAFIDLVDYSFPSSQGILVKNNTLTALTRSIVGTTNQISVANGDGVNGNPTISLPTALDLTGTTVQSGVFLSGSGTTGNTFADVTDPTKKIRFSVSNQPTGTNTIIFPASGGTLLSSTSKLSDLAATTSAQLASVISDETGTGVLVFNASPTFTGTIAAAAATFSSTIGVTGQSTLTGGALVGSGGTQLNISSTGIINSSAANNFSGVNTIGTLSVTTPSITIASVNTYSFPLTQAVMETGTSNSFFVTPGLQKNHPLHPKAWVNITGGTSTIISSGGVSGVSRTGTGVYVISFSTSFSSTSYFVMPSCFGGATICGGITRAVGTVTVSYFTTAGVPTDPTEVTVACFGDQ